jgi:hypothetical protein
MTIQEIEFDNMVNLIVSYDQEGHDADLADIFKTVREICPSAFDKLLLITAACKDPRFESAGAADAARILKAFETTSNFKADLDRFLGIMLDVDYLAEFQVRVATGDYFAKAAKKFVEEYGESAQAYADVEKCLAQ